MSYFRLMSTLRVDGADLYYQLRGTGPLLLISQSGEGDADRSTDLVDQLVADYTVLTYDRRGLSRSTLDDPAAPVTIAAHAYDVHCLLASQTDEAALMLGCSLGAVIGLHLAAHHPEQLSVLVAHEPVAPWLLPEPERRHHQRELAKIQEIYRAAGLPAAFTEIARVLGIDPAAQDVEPDLTPQPMTPQRIANFGFFIERDFSAVVEDEAQVIDGAVGIVPAVGRTTPRKVFDYACAAALADLVGTGPAEFPGGHNGNTTHPRAYAARLREVLSAA